MIMALAHDQFDNGVRIERLNLGDWLTPAQFDPRRVSERLDRLLHSPSVNSAGRDIANKLAARDGLRRTADAIETKTKMIG